jgi:hypothetical protein
MQKYHKPENARCQRSLSLHLPGACSAVTLAVNRHLTKYGNPFEEEGGSLTPRGRGFTI